MAVRKILLLGNDNLYKACSPIEKEELPMARAIIRDLHDTILDFRQRHGFGRAIAAPQINELYRIIYMNLDGKSTAFINPKLEFVGKEKFEVWDDCMSFPGLEVRVNRFKTCRISYKDENWEDCLQEFTGDLSELIQHEYDHLDGLLAVQRAIDNRAFRINKDKLGVF